MRVRVPSDLGAILAAGLVGLQLLGCSDVVSPDESAAISVIVKAVGAFPPDQFEIRIDGHSMTLLATDKSLVVKGLSAGTHIVSLGGLPGGCVIKGLNPLTVQTSSTDLSTVEFTVNCLGVGTLAFVSAREGAPHIYLSTSQGTDIRRLTDQLTSEFTPAWSPDGERLAFNGEDGTYVIKRDGSGLRRLEHGGSSPSWSPDSQHLLVTDSVGFRIIPVDDASERVIDVTINEHDVSTYGITNVYEGTWSPDGSRIAFSAWTGWDMMSLFVMRLNGSAAQPIVRGNVIWDECGPRWSPDGNNIAVLAMAYRAAATVSAYAGEAQTVFETGTTCWDNNYGRDQSQSGLAWSPDGKALAVTTRNPPWEPDNLFPGNQRVSIAIVDVRTHAQLALIDDAYDPTWTR